MRNSRLWRLAAVGLSLLYAGGSHATLLDDIGYTALSELLGEALPEGDLSTVDQVEASSPGDADPFIYLANDAIFPSTTVVDRSGTNSSEFSSHANGVATRFAAGAASQTPALAQIDGYEVNNWLINVLNWSSSPLPVENTGVVGNHSYRAGFENPVDAAEFLLRYDWLIAEDDYFLAAGATSASSSLLFAHAMNGVTVKNTAATASMSSVEIDATYVAGRPAIHLVVPEVLSSNATAVVTSSVILLREIFPSLSLNPAVLKAGLMAGADRQTSNSQNGDLLNYGALPSLNGLDYRYGAGQLNVFNSYNIIAGGEQDSGAVILESGYDIVESYGSENEV
ncbi:MAG: hypothetical protein AAF387_18585, partial [Pseudomonadota bacterium]